MPRLAPTRQQVDPAVKEALRVILRTDLYALCHFLNDGRPDNALTDDFHKPVCHVIQTTPYRKNLYLLPRGHMKTSVITVARNLQRLLQNPYTRILIASNKSELSEAMLAELKQHATNEKLIWLFPEILYKDPAREAEKWTSSAITVKRPRVKGAPVLKEASVETIGLAGELTGKHYDHGTFDDIVGKENSQTKELREGVIEFVKAAEPLFDPGATQDFVGCLPADAMVLMADGTERRINEVKPGDLVQAPDDDYGVHSRAVLAMVPQGLAKTLTITTCHHTLRATPNHPFLVRDDGLEWVRADMLSPGDLVMSIGSLPGVLCIDHVESVVENPDPEPVYDLTVEGTPSFFANGLAVHNTPWHYADAWSWLIEQRDKHGLPLGVYADPCWVPAQPGEPHAGEVPGYGLVKPRFPERFPISELLAIRAVRGSAEFAAQYLLNPVSSDTAVFRREKIHIAGPDERPPVDTLWLCMTVDPAISTKSWSDYSALAVGGFDPTGDLWILDLRRGKWHESELVAQIYDALARVGGTIRAIGFETVGFAKIYKRILTQEGERRGVYLPVVGLERDTKITKQIRIRALQPPWEAGQIHLASTCPARDDFLEEAERFRVDRESAHDDLLDAVVDLYQLRVRPAAQVPERERYLLDDPEALARQRFEWALLEQKPGMDQTSLRVAWNMHRHYAAKDEQRELAALGAERDEFWS